mmetsp:Transcript_5637/g.10319  ORF Transcript_5637/g.10319 Transcript_5637/m.10319 type:complete len:205 (+) Transcript_5637:119-733(+)
MMMVTMRFALVLFAAIGSVMLPVATSYTVGNGPSTSTGPAFSRRNMLRTTLLGGAAFGAQLSRPSVAAAAAETKVRAADAELIQSTSDGYRAALADKEKFVADLASETPSATSPLPPQIPAATFQKIAKMAHDVEKMEADDFPFVAVEYAEHAGAARDFAKCARLGRIGENGSAEVALDYAQRCVLEMEEASVVLDTLRQALDL